MDLNGRRESGNVVDRRGQSSGGGFGGFSSGGGGFNLLQLLLQLFLMKRGSGGGTNNAAGGGKGGCGCLMIVLVLVVLFFLMQGMGGAGGCSDILGGMMSGGGMGATYGDDDTEQTTTPYQGSELEEELATFTKKILAGTEDVWTAYFQKMGKTYQAPKLVLFTDAVRSGCGAASSSTGPFYCSADQTVYIDLSFFMNMKQQIGADGDFAYAYVIAHEIGHHVQNQLGTLEKVHQQMARYGQDSKEANQLSVRLELQADFYAGVWAHQDNAMFGSLEEGDIEEGLNAASKIGDDYLQKKARGYTVPESFNHGTSAQRNRWLKLGIKTGDITKGDTFSPRYENL
jgi:predicted metalloprotease